MTLRVILTDGNGIAGLSGVFGAFLTTSSIDAAASAAAAAVSATQAATSASAASTSENNALSSAQQAGNYATQSASSATASANSATNSQSSATASSGSANQAATSATQAAGSATAAASSATDSGNSANLSKNWANQLPGTVDGTEYSSKYYAQASSTSAGNAATSATQAASSATAAANSATAAANSVASLNSEYAFSTTGGTTTLTTQQAASGIIKVSGTLVSNAIIVVPATPHNFVVQNLTTGTFSLTVQAAGQTPSASVLQGNSASLFSDPTGVYATSATPGIGFSAEYTNVATLSNVHIGALDVISTASFTATLPKAATIPAGLGVTVKALLAASLALFAGDTWELASSPYPLLANDTIFMFSDGVSKWSVGWYSNKENPSFDGVVTSTTGGFKFPDGTTQTTANGTTAPASQLYVVGTTDTLGQFAIGDTSLRTNGFNAPLVEVKRGGLWLTRGKHYTLNVDNIHLNGFDPFSADDTDVEVLTKVIHSPSTAYSPQFVPLTLAGGLSFIPFVHVQGFAPLMNGGQWLNLGSDYTEDATGYYLQGFQTAVNDSWAVWNLTPITLANMLSKVNPTIGSGPLTFADGSTQGTAVAGRNRIINGDMRVAQRGAAAFAAAAIGYGGPDRFFCANQNSAGGQFTQSQGSLTGSVQCVAQNVNTAVASLTANNVWNGFQQGIEGYDCYDLGGNPFVISFLFNTSTSGLYTLALRDNGSTNSYVTTFNAQANALNKIVIAVPANSNLNIPNSNAAGLTLNIGTLNQGNIQTSTLNAWQSGNFFSAAGTVNWGATSGNWIALAYLQLEQGTIPTPFERIGYQQQLAKCQRFYWTTFVPGQGPGTTNAAVGVLGRVPSFGAGNDAFPIVWQGNFPIPMRAVPACAAYSNITGASGMIRSTVDIPAMFGLINPNGITLQVSNTPVPAGSNLYANVTASAEF